MTMWCDSMLETTVVSNRIRDSIRMRPSCTFLPIHRDQMTNMALMNPANPFTRVRLFAWRLRSTYFSALHLPV